MNSNYKALSVSFSIALSILSVSANGQEVFAFDFDSGFQGWTTPDTSTFWQPNGGNPSGYVQKVDFFNTQNKDAYIYAPESVLGNWLRYDGISTLSFDHRIFDTGDLGFFVNYEVILSGPNDMATWHGPVPIGATQWVSFEIPLASHAWDINGNWLDLLSDISNLQIRMEVVSNIDDGEVTGVDNVKLTVTALLGDVNCDGDVNLLDVAPFVESITSGSFNPKADISQDGVVDLLDVSPFVELLTGQ